MRRDSFSSQAAAFINVTLSTQDENGECKFSTIPSAIRGSLPSKAGTSASVPFKATRWIERRAWKIAEELEPGQDAEVLSGEDLIAWLTKHHLTLSIRVRVPGDASGEEADFDDEDDF